MMRIIIAPDSFKESMAAFEVAVAMERGVRKVAPKAEIIKVPIADGGEGTVQTFLDAFNGKRITTTVTGPLGDRIMSTYGIVNEKTAVIEVAAACGLELIPIEKRNPMLTTSYGVGELMKDALNHDIRHFIIGLGGSGTNDGGIGMAQALGAEILDEAGRQVSYGGKGLQEVSAISLEGLDKRLADCTIQIASDVNNQLLGKSGATAVYGPQKGAHIEMIDRLDQAMSDYAAVLKRDVGIDVINIAGAGAAGGLGAACLSMLQATLHPGIDIVIEQTDLASKIKNATLVLTGEGKIDDQTSYGKAITGVAHLAKHYHVPVVAITGADQTTTDELYHQGVTAIFTLISEPMSLHDAMEHRVELMEEITENVMRLFVKVNQQ